MPKNCCFRIVVLEKTLESPLDCKDIKPVILKGNRPGYSLETEVTILWPPDAELTHWKRL